MAKYDPDTCVCAGELRELGMAVPEHIPDVAWVPRYAVKIDEKNMQCSLRGPGTIHVGLSCRFSEPFKWVDCKIEIGGKGGEHD